MPDKKITDLPAATLPFDPVNDVTTVVQGGVSKKAPMGIVTSVGQPVATAKTASFTMAAADQGSWTPINSASGVTVTLPQDSADTGILVGHEATFDQRGAGQVTFTLGTGASWAVAPNPGAKTRVQGSIVTVKKMAANTYYLFGDISA